MYLLELWCVHLCGCVHVGTYTCGSQTVTLSPSAIAVQRDLHYCVGVMLTCGNMGHSTQVANGEQFVQFSPCTFAWFQGSDSGHHLSLVKHETT